VRYLAAALALPLLAACGRTQSSGDAERSAAGWTRRPNSHAVHFHAWRSPAGEALLVTGAEGDTLARLLITDDQGLPGPTAGEWTRLRPQERELVLLSTTHGAFIATLDATDRVAACALAELQRDSALVRGITTGRIASLASNASARQEQLAALPPALVLDHPFGGGHGVPPLPHLSVPVCEYMEPHPLGRAEWLRFFGLLVGRSSRADSIFSAIAARYTGLVRSAGDASPLVFLGSAWRGTWSVPSGNSLMARLVADAGGRYRHAERRSAGNIDLPLEVVMADAHVCTHWGVLADVPALRTAADLPGVDQRMLGSPVFRSGSVFVANSAEADLFGRAMVEPDVLLADLCAMLHPQQSGYRPTYLRVLTQ